MPASRPWFTREGLRHLDAVLTQFIEAGSHPSIVSLLTRNDQQHVTIVGSTGFDTAVPLPRDAIFRQSSTTKPITAVAMMILVDDGVLALDAAVDRFLPELANRDVLRAPAGPLDDTVSADRAITLQDLLTFRFGLGMIADGSPIARAMHEARVGTGMPDVAGHLPADEWLANLGTLPLAYQPGETWLYHTAAEVLGILIARASGQPFDRFMQERIFDPLGMVDTGFHVPAGKRDRLTDAYMPDANGRPIVWDPAAASAYASPPTFCNGADGLVSTLDDYQRFASMMLNGGVHDGQRIISAASHARMVTNHLTQAQIANAAPMLDGKGWGYGQAVDGAGNDHPGRYGWAGGMGTYWFNDPARDLTMTLMTPVAFFSAAGARLIAEWEQAVYMALE